MLHGTLPMLLSLASLLLAQDSEKRSIGDLVDEYLSPSGSWFERYEKSLKLGIAFSKDRKTAIREVGDALARIDVKTEDEYSRALRAIAMLSGIMSEESVKALDKAYVRWKGDNKFEVGLRRNIIVALRVNGLEGRETLMVKEPRRSLAALEQWLKTEPSPYVLEYGLQVLSSNVSELDPDVMKNMAGKIPGAAIAEASRKAKVNAQKDYAGLFREVMAWVDELVKDIEATGRDWPEKDFSDRALIDYFIAALSRDPGRLLDHVPDVKQRIEQIDKSLNALDKKLKLAVSEKERKRLEVQQDQLARVRDALRWVIKKE
ncbi:MAG: hypothetical protein K2R98_05085 [Gemmataceae bacterium]|nr:hypothetical protein [Gemmataceae bacterium]